MERLIFSGRSITMNRFPDQSKQPWTTGCKVVKSSLIQEYLIIPFIYGPVSWDKHCFTPQIPSYASFFFFLQSPLTQMKHHTKDYMWSLTAPLLYACMHYSYWSCALKNPSCNYWVHAPKQLKPSLASLWLLNKRSHSNKKPLHHN